MAKGERKGKRRTRSKQFRRQPLEPHEADALYAACDNDLDRLIVGVLLGTGLRVSEFCSLTPQSVLHQQDRLRVKGKGGKYRTVPLVDSRARALLTSWFASHDEIGLGVRAVQKHVKAIAERSGVEKHVTPHVLRHTFGRNAIDRGVNIRALQEAMGHADLNTTMLYTFMDADHVIDEFKEKME